MAAESASEAEQASTTEATVAEAETGPADGPGSPEVQAEVVERVEIPEVSEDSIGPVATDEFRSNGLLQAAASTTETAATTTTAATITTAGLVTEEAAPNTRFPEVPGTDNQLHHPESFQEDPIYNDPTVNVPIQQSRKNPMIPIQANPVGSNPSLFLGRPRYVLLGPYQTVRVVFCSPFFLGTKRLFQFLDF